MMDTLGRPDHTLAHDAVTGLEAGNVLADFDDLANPFMTRDNGVGNRDDVLAGKKLVVRVANVDAARQATVSILPLRADAKTASSNAILFTRCSAVIR